ncbi:hypothetical protein ACKI1J_11845 [Streptomyces scabiei]|uniref:hypothetical protein n=1 Tax=Streptomyces scabiei TaxID=1930 RepID=UPI0038F6D988
MVRPRSPRGRWDGDGAGRGGRRCPARRARRLRPCERRRRRKPPGTRRRKGTPGPQATVRRWVLEVLDLLAARARRPDRVLKKVARRGGAVVLLDGTLVRTHRRTGADHHKNRSGTHKAHGLLLLAPTDERGHLIWIFSARPVRAGEINAARHDHLTGHRREGGLDVLAVLGFVGQDDGPEDAPVIITGRKATRSHRLTDAE